MKFTKIQWCDSTVNPVMGCGGCELWPHSQNLKLRLVNIIVNRCNISRKWAETVVSAVVGGSTEPTKIWHARENFCRLLSRHFPEVKFAEFRDSIESQFRCYAGVQHMMRGGTPDDWTKPNNPGFAPIFENPKKYEGRVAKAAKWSDLLGQNREGEPWLNGLPRTIFVSDMGDALSDSVSFEFLKNEIIDAVLSADGQRHIWLWLSKRPGRMAEFARWLQDEHGLSWPDNLVAMTSVTNKATRRRIDDLRQVPARFRGVSVEPLVEKVELDLDGIDWVIVGGESGNHARDFDIEWARAIKRQCRDSSVAFFVKQLGSSPVQDGFPIPLVDGHGGDWNEWPRDLRDREMPQGFRDWHSGAQRPRETSKGIAVSNVNNRDF